MLPHQSAQRAHVPWGPRDVVLGSAALFIWLAGVRVAIAVSTAEGTTVDSAVWSGPLELPLLAPVWWFTLHKYKVGTDALGFRGFPARALEYALALLIAAFGLACCYTSVFSGFAPFGEDDLLTGLGTTQNPLLAFLSATVCVPVVEEIVFRSFMFAGLRERVGIVGAALAASSVFALAHLRPMALVPLFALGFGLCVLYDRFHSIWPAVIAHLLSNICVLGLAMWSAPAGFGGM
jgi:membrane protease YdiL (CAAX protease family)